MRVPSSGSPPPPFELSGLEVEEVQAAQELHEGGEAVVLSAEAGVTPPQHSRQGPLGHITIMLRFTGVGPPVPVTARVHSTPQMQGHIT
eukprot:1194336-Prorocentrum_minimum.AAC.11